MTGSKKDLQKSARKLNTAARKDRKVAGRSVTGGSKAISVPSQRKIVRRKSGEHRRSEILEVARDLIFDEGFSNFTVREVAGRVGISEAAIYRHFASKEELLLALLDALFVPWREAISRLVDDDLSFDKVLEELCQLHLHHLLNERLNPILFLSEAVNPQNTRLLASMRHNLGFLKNSVAVMVATGKQRGQIRPALDSEAIVSAVLGLMQTSVINWTLQRSSDGLFEAGARNMAELARAVMIQETKR